MESLLFLLFTMCMLGDQLSSLHSNQTGIDRLKNQKHDTRVEINEVCGSPIEIRFQWSWLVPVAVFFADAIKEKILGYRVSVSSSSDYDDSRAEVTPLMEGRPEKNGIQIIDSKIKEKNPVDAPNGDALAIAEVAVANLSPKVTYNGCNIHIIMDFFPA
jgi:hypothetical protein